MRNCCQQIFFFGRTHPPNFFFHVNSYNQSHRSDNAGSLTGWATRELQPSLFFRCMWHWCHRSLDMFCKPMSSLNSSNILAGTFKDTIFWKIMKSERRNKETQAFSHYSSLQAHHLDHFHVPKTMSDAGTAAAKNRGRFCAHEETEEWEDGRQTEQTSECERHTGGRCGRTSRGLNTT